MNFQVQDSTKEPSFILDVKFMPITLLIVQHSCDTPTILGGE